ncbi:MAG: FAD:protein FMN transferase [Acholeplasmatales bacterium]|nr:FAD:protein FMN transferase [Acholeplasmatales bacterium]
MKKKIIIIISSILAFFLLLSIFIFRDNIFPHLTYSKSFWAFDTTISIKIYDEDNSKKYVEHIEEEFKELSNECDDYSGLLYELNQNREVDSKKYLADIINNALILKEETNGYFNPFMGRITHLYKENIDSINDELIKNELDIVNNSSVEISGNHIKINGDANIDLGAITKGYATKLAKEYLEENGIKKYLINSGESSISVGSKTHRIGLLKPLDTQRDYYAKIKLSNIGISTSAISYQKYHIISPKTGVQETYYQSISVISDNDLKNDVYSTAIFSMPEDELTSFANSKNIELYAYQGEDNVKHIEKI